MVKTDYFYLIFEGLFSPKFQEHRIVLQIQTNKYYSRLEEKLIPKTVSQFLFLRLLFVIRFKVNKRYFFAFFAKTFNN